MNELWDPVKQWMGKADNDLAAAKLLAAAQPPLRDTAIYHCQQAGEKALKAALAWRRKPLQKTHDLRILLDLVVTDCPALETLRNAAKLLSPYAMAFRYPRGPAMPSAEEMKKALAAAEEIVQAIHKLIG